MYVQFLANSLTSTASLKNYVSGARHWILHHGGDPSSFSSLPVADITKRLTSASAHVPAQAAPISPVNLKIICEFIDSSPSLPLCIKPCILISFVCMLIASNVISPTLTSWGGAHTLRAADIQLNPTGMLVIIGSSKTSSKARPQVLQILPSQDPNLCPVRALRHYAMNSVLRPSGPAFVLPSGRPLTASPVVCVIRSALGMARRTDVMQFSMHSLRRGQHSWLLPWVRMTLKS